MLSFRSLPAFVTIVGLPLGWHLPAIAQITASPNSTTLVTPNAQNQLAITGGIQAGSNLFHSFEQFGLNQGQAANFQVNGSIANILGRVTGNQASVIDGMLSVSGSNANLYLMNPQGILFGPNVQLNLPAGFTATTANAIGFGQNWFSTIDNADFSRLVGTPTQFAFTSATSGAIVNTGNLTLQPNQSLALLGGTVINTGKIQTPGGTVTIAATFGEKLLRFTPQGGLLSLELPVADKINLGTGVEPLSLGTLLAQGNATNVAIVDGKVRLTGADVTVPATPGTALVNGEISVASDAEKAGEIKVTGDRLGLFSAKLNASGAEGGGTILVGGEFQGKGELPNAQRTVVDRNTQIQANAIRQGDGGRVILWADGTTAFSGEIDAQSVTGKGGFVEVSGKQNLNFTGEVDVNSGSGQAGALLLDPAIVTIDDFAVNDNAQLDDGQILASDTPGGNFIIHPDKIEQLLNTNTNVSISATDEIRLGILGSIDASGSGSLSLSVPSMRFETFRNNAIEIAGNFNLNLTGNSPVEITRDFTAQQINIQSSNALTLNGFRTIASDQIRIQAPTISLNSDLQAVNTINLQGESIILNSSSLFSTTNIVNLNATNAINLSSGSQITGALGISVISQGTLSGNQTELITPRNLNLQATNNLEVRNSRFDVGGNLDISTLNGPMILRGMDVFVGGDLTTQTPQTIAIEENNAPATRSVFQIQGNTRLVGNQGVFLNALDQNQSAIRSTGNIALVSDGPIVSNTRLLSEGNITFQTTAGNPANITYNPQSSNGIVSAVGNIEFGDYTGNSLKVEAGGSIRGGNINITSENTTLAGTDPDIANLAANPAVILRAGVTPATLATDRYPTLTERRNSNNLLPGFTASATTSSGPATITVGNIEVNTAAVRGIDTVVLTAPGAITAGQIQADGGNVFLQSQTGDITAATISTRKFGGGGGNVTISTNARVRLTDTFNFTYQDPFPDFTTTATSILTGSSSGSNRNLPGIVKIRSGSSQFVEDYGSNPPADNVSGSAGRILRANGSNASLIPAFQNQIFLSGSGTLDTPPVNPNGGGGQPVNGVIPSPPTEQLERTDASACEFDPTIDATDESCQAGEVDQDRLLKLLE